MNSHITLMIGDKPSTKHYSVDEVLNIAKKGHVQQAYFHTAIAVPLTNIVDLYDTLAVARDDDKCYVIRGLNNKSDQIDGVRRLRENFDEVGTSWICCDFDQYEVGQGLERNSLGAIEYLIEKILPGEFRNVSYIYQRSASAGLEYNGHAVKSGTNVHLFFYLNRAVNDKELKMWFRDLIDTGFDPSTFNTVTPIFVSKHVIKDDRIVDTIAEEDKFGIVAKDQNEVIVPKITIREPAEYIGLSFDTSNRVLQRLSELGVIYKRSTDYIKLWHPKEKTRGDWFVYAKDPSWVKHQVKKSKRVDRWVKEFWHAELGVAIDPGAEKYAQYLKSVDEMKLIEKRLKELKCQSI